MARPDKKQRHKAKREAKRREARRRDSISPVKRLADSKGEIECWMSDDFDRFGQAQFMIFKSTAGLNGVACFLVDRGVVGLKDAWTKFRVDRGEWDDMLKASGNRGIPMRRCDLRDVRYFVAGGIRWAHDNGMRLPKDWTRATAFIGGIGDWASADVSRFAKEFAGHPEDLRRRLISMPFADYIRRSDIDFMFSDNAPVLDHRTGEYLDDEDLDDEEEFIDDEDLPIEELNTLAKQFTESSTALAGLTESWLGEKNQTPSKELVEAWISTMMAVMVSKAALPDAPPDELNKFGMNLIGRITDRIDESRLAEFSLGMEQVLQHLGANPDILKNEVMKDRSMGGFVHQPAQE